jgi:hypothetical protein
LQCMIEMQTYPIITTATDVTKLNWG